MRLLRALAARGVVVRVGEFPAERARDVRRRGLARLGRDVRRVRSHVGDEAGLVEVLREAHRAVGREAESVRGGLLERRGREGRAGALLRLARLDRAHGVGGGAEERLGALRGGLVADLGLPPVELAQAHGEGLAGAGAALGELHGVFPVGLRDERAHLALAVADEAKRHGLHAPGAGAAADRAGDLGGDAEAEVAVDAAARLLGVDAGLVDVVGIREGGRGGRAGTWRRGGGPAPRAGARRSPRPRGRGRSRGRSRPPGARRRRGRRRPSPSRAGRRSRA